MRPRGITWVYICSEEPYFIKKVIMRLVRITWEYIEYNMAINIYKHFSTLIKIRVYLILMNYRSSFPVFIIFYYLLF